MKAVSGLVQLDGSYDALLVDAWGVLHDGREIFPSAKECLAELRRRAKPVLIVSNAARRRDAMRRELESVGVGADLYQDLFTSGEMAWQALAAKRLPLAPDARGYYLGPRRSRGLCDGLDYRWTDSLAAAGFVLNAGAAAGNPASAAALQPLVAEMVERRLPMICANPDLCAVRAGVRGISAGAIAELYSRLGGEALISFGKPGREIFRLALEAVPRVDAARVLMVGDAFATDIAGASRSGLASLLIAGGIHADELEPLGPGPVARLAARYRCRPDYYCDRLRWRAPQ